MRLSLSIYCFIIYVFASCNVRDDGYAIIKGRIVGESAVQEVQLISVSNGVPAKYAGTSIAFNGSFAFMFEPEEGKPYYYLYDGHQYCRLYVKKGTVIDLEWKDGNFTVLAEKGENFYLEEWRKLKRQLHSDSIKGEYGAFFTAFDEVKKQSDLWLENVSCENRDFAEALKDEVRLDLLNEFVSYLLKNQQMYESEERDSEYYQQIMKTFPEQGEALLAQPYGIRLLQNYFNYKQTFVIRNRDYTLNERLEELSTPVLKAEYILAEVPRDNYADYCNYERLYLSLLPNEAYRTRFRHLTGRPVSVLKKGELAPNFIYEDIEGNECAVSDFKGKYKYVDIWATWCAPCKQEIPSLQQLEEEFAKHDIVFISISIDTNKKKWEDFVKEKQLGGVQLWAGDWAEIPQEVELGSVPRFMLIDPEGRWVDVNAMRPSNPEMKKMLEQLLKR